MKLNQLSTRRVATETTPGRYADGGGLYLQVTKLDDDQDHVTKAWLFRFMMGGRARSMGLGSVGTFGLAEARERARLARQKVADGIDPIEARLSEQDARRTEEDARIIFKDAAARYIEVHEPGWRNDKHRRQWRSSLTTYAFPTLGDRPVSAIDAALINHALAPIWSTRAETASRVKQRVERIIAWVKSGMPLPAPSKSKRVKHHDALPYTDLPDFMAELRKRDGISARALEFTVLTASRTGEAIGARWSELDLAEKVWTIPAGRMKAHKQHRVPLSDRVLEILNKVPRERGNDHVFLGAAAGKGLSNMAMLELIRGMRPGLTVHGFRSTFKDWASERTSYPNIVSEAALAHTIKDGVEAAYRRGDLFGKRQRLMAEWGRYCNERPRARANNVTAIRAEA